MTHREKVRRLIADLKARGVNPFTTAPPLWRLAWLLGFELTPPHFIDSRSMAVVGGAAFGPIWAALMWFFFWRAQGLLYCFVVGIPTGFIFGHLLAKRYRSEAERLYLPPWDDYPSA